MVRRLGALLYFEKKRRTFINEVPIWEKSNLTLEEAAAYSGIGINKLRQLTNDEDCEFVVRFKIVDTFQKLKQNIKEVNV